MAAESILVYLWRITHKYDLDLLRNYLYEEQCAIYQREKKADKGKFLSTPTKGK